MSEKEPVSVKDVLLPTSDADIFNKLRTYLNKKSCSCCFDLRPLAHARIVREREMSGYTTDLWTLNESRWTSQAKSPSYGDEPFPERPVGDIWQDYHFDRPTNVLLNKGESQEVVKDLKETQRRERCSKCEFLGEIKCTACSGVCRQNCNQCHQKGTIECCHDESCSKCKGIGLYKCTKCLGSGKTDCPTCHTRGRIQCPDCKGLRFILTWIQLHVKWENHHSSIIQDCGNSSILPASEIANSSGKVTCLQFDDVWSSSTQSIDSVLDSCVGLPADLRIKICEKYQTEHCSKSTQILRLRCVIQRVPIKEIDYAFNQTPDETYTLCV